MGDKPVAKAMPAADSDAQVTDLEAHRQRRGPKSGLGYDPATGEEYANANYVAAGSGGPDSETDVFKLVERRGYSEDRFYTKSNNQHDHGERMNVRVPKGIDSQVYAAVAKVPEYRGPQDFWRDAALHRLEYLQNRYSMSDSARRFLELERITADLERGNVESQTMADAVTDFGNKLDELWQRQDWGMMYLQLQHGDELLEWLRDPYETNVAEIMKHWKAKAKIELQRMRDALDE